MNERTLGPARGSASADTLRHVIERLCENGFALIASGEMPPGHPELRVTRNDVTFAWLSIAEPLPGWLYLAQDVDAAIDISISPTVRRDTYMDRPRFHLQSDAEADHVLDILLPHWD